ncbi:HAMP domain-containing histidine kinase [Echinicola marina]|uniref:sensor histidine kinase n=1 Tax=Echinicola marina TaxID=2859768 RepID=UPI001CF6F3A1|nr:HAMP domain-containing sensor histidine kinase [Echinicola marina]UCS95319.1 HAMP domain-containing histidine kinase [Echinicola marina]
MEGRIFNSTVIFLILYLAGMVIFNLITGQKTLSFILTLTAMVVIIAYILARKTKNFKNGIRILAAISYPILAINFFLNDGIDGPSAYIFLMIHLIILTLSDRKEFWFWGAYNFIFFSSLYIIGIKFPELIPKNYENINIQIYDHLLTYLACLIGIIAIIAILKWNYHKQKLKSEFRNKAFKEANLSLKNSLEQKNKIIALISHDLKNPLISITNILQMIKEDELSEEETKTVQEDLLLMATNTQKMAEGILDWAAIELKSSQPIFKTINIQERCLDTLEIYKSLAEQKGITFTQAYSGHLEIITDPDRILLIIRNLLQNAIKFTPPKGEIHFSYEHKGQYANITIKDTGVGIAEEKLESIFSKNYISSLGTASEKGYGLGLYICKENASKIGGQLDVISEIGIGTTFFIKLPTA